MGRTTEAVSTVFIVGVGLKVTLRPAFARGSTFERDGGRRGVLSVAVVEAIEALDAIATIRSYVTDTPAAMGSKDCWLSITERAARKLSGSNWGSGASCMTFRMPRPGPCTMHLQTTNRIRSWQPDAKLIYC